MRRFLAASILFIFTQQALAVGGYTAVAYDPATGLGNQSNNGAGWYTQQDADTQAMNKCSARSSGCLIVGDMYSGYIALYADQSNPANYGVGTGVDQGTAEQQAQALCAQNSPQGDNCVEVVYGYSFP